MTTTVIETVLRHDLYMQETNPTTRKEYREYAGGQNYRRGMSEIENMGFAHEYAELGYTNPATGILFADWNPFTNDAIRRLEELGFECEWSDEWSQCEDCGKAFRVSPDSYGWQPSYFTIDECSQVYRECCDIPAYLESIEDKPTHAVNDHISPADYGYVKLEGEFENGFHPGQNDNPREIYKRLHEQGKKRLLFNIDCVGQFDITFSIWQHESEQHVD